MTGRSNQRCPGEEANVRIGKYQRMISIACIGRGILNHQQLLPQHSIGTKDIVARGYRSS